MDSIRFALVKRMKQKELTFILLTKGNNLME